MQLIQEVTWLAPNAWTLSHDCEWFGKFVAICGIIRWSTLNLVRCLLNARKLEYCFQHFICKAFDQQTREAGRQAFCMEMMGLCNML